jgi:cullin-associated NEDD8-dissociated protein 1
LGPFVDKLPEPILRSMIERIANLQTDNAVDASVPALALRAIVLALPRPMPGVPRSKPVLEASDALSRSLIPRLVGYTVLSQGRRELSSPPNGMLGIDLQKGIDSNALDVLTEVAKCFGSILQESEIEAMQRATFDILESEKAGSVLKKKAVIALSALAHFFSDSLLSAFISRLIESLRNAHLTHKKRILYITILGSLAKSIPKKFGPYLQTLAPFVLSAVSEDELRDEIAASIEDDRRAEVDEVKEAALTALESFLAFCGDDMRIYTTECISAAIRFLSYDPNLAEDEILIGGEDDNDGDSSGDDEDFEEEEGFDEEDDSSWRVRRCAAKILLVIIQTRSSGDLLEDGTLYNHIAPALISRFKEREESVRLEILSALTCLVRKTAENAGLPGSRTHMDQNQTVIHPPTSRKRRRGGSDASLFESQTLFPSAGSPGHGQQMPLAPTAPQTSLSNISPKIIQEVSQLLKASSLPTKQAGIILLKDIVVAQCNGLSENLEQMASPIVNAISITGHQVHGSANSKASSVTSNSLREHALQLVAVILETHPPNTYRHHLEKIIPALVKAVTDKQSRVSIEALLAIEQAIRGLTSPRATISGQQARSQLEQVYNVIVSRISATDTDLEVKRIAIRALGLLLGRAVGTQGLLSEKQWDSGLSILGDRLKNELTRLATIKAIESVALLGGEKAEFHELWIRSVCLELASQLRKASRALRGASLQALRAFILNPALRRQLDKQTIRNIEDLLVPLLTGGDLLLLSRSLQITSAFVEQDASTVVNKEMINALCSIVKMSVAGSALEALLNLINSIGRSGVGKPLMLALLQDVGVSASHDLLGKVIGTLLVSGGTSVGFKLEDFSKELRNAKDGRRQCLALSVLGEAGLRLGKASPLQPDLFMSYFISKYEQVPLTAAIALGRAGSSNIYSFLPAILNSMQSIPDFQYLLLHSIKEFLQYSVEQAEIIPYTQDLWQNLIEASKAEDNKAITAECIGRLAIIDPRTYLPQLQVFCTRLSFIVAAADMFYRHSSKTINLACEAW